MAEERRADDARLDQILEYIRNQPERQREQEERQEKLFDLKLAPVFKTVDMYGRTLFGDGTDAYPGLKTKNDRQETRIKKLEDDENKREWYFRTAIAALIASCIEFGWKLVHWGKP